MMRRARYLPRHGGILAIAAGSCGAEFDTPGRAWPFETAGDVAIVDIRGPLLQHTDYFWDSYDSITQRVRAAIESPCKAVLLRIDSPGGDALGVFETARELRALATASGKKLVAYADGMIASAAYALACAASAIYVPAAGFVGSVGVMQPMLDTTAMDRAMGLNFAVIASGSRKLDGNPHVPISEAAVAETQARVDSLAELFFDLVSEMRGVPADHVRGLQAALFHGEKAVSAKLADGVVTFNELLATVASAPQPKPSKGQTVTVMDKKEMRAWLAKMAEGEGEEADKAKAALKCLDDADKPAEDDKKDEKAEKAEADAPPEKEEKKDEEDVDAKASVSLAGKIHSLEARIAKKEEAEERKTLLAQRPDFSAEVKATLEKAPLSMLREAVSSWERKPVTTTTTLAAAATVQGTRGQSQGDNTRRTPQLAEKESTDLAERMGMTSKRSAIRREGSGVVFGALAADEARAHLKAQAEQAGKGAGK